MIGKIVMHLERKQEVPMSFLMVDSKMTFSVVSFYHTTKGVLDVIKTGDLVYIKNPQLVFTSIEFKGRLYSFQSVKVAELTDVLLNGHQPLMTEFAANSLTIQNFS